jgi:hypothetical protein
MFTASGGEVDFSLKIWSPTQFDFSFYDFFVIYYDFSKLLQGVICPVLESSGVKNPVS